MPVLPTIALILLGGALAASFASFAFVLGERPARGESIVHQDSYCSNCRTPLRLIDNVPILGWALNGGKAHCCKKPIPAEYFFGELIFFALGAIITARFLFGVPDYYVYSFGPLYVGIVAFFILSVWWKWETMRRQEQNFTVYIEPPVELPSVIANSHQYIYAQAFVNSRRKA